MKRLNTIIAAAAIGLVASSVSAADPASPQLAAENQPKGQTTTPNPNPQGSRPQGRSEADVRRMCTEKFDNETVGLPARAGGRAGPLAGPAEDRFRQCLIQNGVTP